MLLSHLLDLHGVLDDVCDRLLRRLVDQVFEHQTGKVAVKTLKATSQDVSANSGGPKRQHVGGEDLQDHPPRPC